MVNTMPEHDHNWKDMQGGSRTAFLEIYQENYQMLFSYGFSLTKDRDITKDCIQEVFLEIWNSRSSLNKEVSNIRSYLFTWLRRKISRTQLKANRNKASEEFSVDTDQDEPSYLELLIAFQITEAKKEKLARALENLSSKQLEIIRLKFFANLSYAEIAEKTSLAKRTIYNTIHLAIQQLRAEILAARHA